MDNKNKRDILIFISDQHNALYSGYVGDRLVRTPNLDEMAKNGAIFSNAYTACPLCVPARAAMLTGQLPSRTGVFSNFNSIRSDQTTFLHSLGAEGYETVLCGRMHFMGDDQRHGFTKRLVGEITPLAWGRGGMGRSDLGPFAGTFSSARCFEVVGGGNSPVLEYDRAVINAAIDYLSVSHAKPQCIVIGTYAPHSTYVAPSELYTYYRSRVKIPIEYGKTEHPLYENRVFLLSEENVVSCRAAYYGMIENLDLQLGMVRRKWHEYLNINNRDGVMVYLSDHGDQVGEKGLFGKETFYDGAAAIPMIFEGDGVKPGINIADCASILDISPTICAMAGADPPPAQDGWSLMAALGGGELGSRHVLSEFVDEIDEDAVPGRMVRYGKWKLISYQGYEKYDLLFDMENDQFENTNLIPLEPDVYAELKLLLNEKWNTSVIRSRFLEDCEHFKLLAKWGQSVDVNEPERWQVPENAVKLPDIR